MSTTLQRAVAPSHVARPARPRPPWLLLAAVLLGQALVVLDVDLPVVRALVALLVALGLPALVLARRLDWGRAGRVHVACYAVGLSLLGMLVLALVVNTLWPLLGVARPLGRVNLVAVSTAVDLALLGWRSHVPLAAPGALRRGALLVVRARLDPAVALGATSVVLAVAGAVRLNNGASGAVAVLGHVVAGAALVALLLVRPRSPWRDSTVVLLASASLLLATSLRGWYVTGHDIQREYLAYLLTQGADHWSMAPFESPYNACLSINVLPTVLANLTGLSGTVVFKVLLQLVFALVPVLVHLAARTVVSRRLAVLATIFLVAFPTFFNDMPYLVRQEVAFLFLVLALLVAREQSWSITRRRTLVSLLGVGVVLSHYSTTYMMLMALGLGSAAAVVVPRLRRRDASHSSPLVLLHPLVVLALALSTWAWTSPATHSGGHLEETVVSTVSGLVGGDSGPGSSDLGYGLLAGHQATPRERFDLYVDSTLEERATRDPGDLLLDSLGDAELRPRLVDPAPLPLTAVGRTLDAAGLDVGGANGLLRLAAAALLQLFLVVGALALVLRHRSTRRLDREGRWLAVGALGALGLQVAIPSLSVEYGVLRAFQQCLLVTAPLVAIGAVLSLAWLRRLAAPVAAALAAALFLSLTGVVPAVLGGYPGQLALANSGLYYDLYYVDAPEASVARWLGTTSEGAPVQAEVISDKVTASRLQARLRDGVVSSHDFYPTLLERGSYVLLGRAAVRKQEATVFYTGNLITFEYPVQVLRDGLDLVYSSSSTEVYR